ncbi:MAG: hypothetical protein U9N85_14070 [Bacteroidota bacterium]|nr:hypothetical protein [Bacteroidota bacterium]
MKHLYFSLFALLLFNISEIQAQNNMIFGARQVSMGGTGLIYSDIWSSSHNQAGLADIKGYGAGAYYSDRFQLSELGTAAFTLVAAAGKFGTFGLNYTQFGYELYSQNKFGLAYGKRLGKRVSAGIQLDYFTISQGGPYGKQGFATGEIGIQAEPIDNFYVATHVFSPWPVKISSSEDLYVPTIFRLGTGYQFSDEVIVSLEVEKDIENSPIVRFGTEYEIFEQFFIRGGFSSTPAEFAFGIGYNFKNVQLDLAFKNHNTLGFSSHAGLSYLTGDDK